ncbi:MAG: YdcF family protein [Oligoflexia bacterium]|nr:YdcF family protein [Oligoflexia bacterium]
MKNNYKSLLGRVLWFLVVFFLVYQLYGVFSYVTASMGYQQNPEIPNDADMIVVLTGSAGRINGAYQLMKSKDIKMLLLCGVDPQVSIDELIAKFELEEKFRDRYEIDNISTTTMENAQVVAEYIIRKNVKKIVLVTSIYHMKRAYFMFERILEGTGVEVYPFSVYNSPIDTERWWNNSGVFKNIFSEYLKFRFYQVLFKLV